MKREEKINYFTLLLLFALGYFFGFCLIGIITYPVVKFNEKDYEYAMKNGMICGFCICILILILLQIEV